MELANRLIEYRCLNCSTGYPVDPFPYTCKNCGQNLDAVFDYSRIGSQWAKADLAADPDRSIWRYLPLLPVQSSPEKRSIQVGGTPLVEAPCLSNDYGIKRIFIKDDTRNPSGSLKDRASEVGLQHAAELGQDILVAASTGNAAASLAALAAFYAKQAIILVPADAPKAKLTQILQYGAILCPVDGTYDEAFDLAGIVAEEYGWYLRSTGINPVLSEGKKTVALEIAEQLNWVVPDKIFVPVGDGCIIGGVYKGFYDLKELGWIDRLPEIITVQAFGSAAVINALAGGGNLESVVADTVADSIAVDFPRDGLKALRAVRNTGGFGIAVTDDEILWAQKELSEKSGIFAEPAAAAAVAGFVKARHSNQVSDNDTVILLVTGSGLKDITAAQRMLAIPVAVKPEIDAFHQFYSKIRKTDLSV